MSTTNIGKMSGTLSLSAFEFLHGLQQSSTATIQFADTVETQSRKASASMDRVAKSAASGGMAKGLAGVTAQAGYALQDFTSQLETRGLSGAIGAVTNNVQAMGSAFGPVGMAITAVGGALAGVLLPKLIESSGWFGKTKEQLDEISKAYSDFSNTFMSRANLRTEASNMSLEQFDKAQDKRRSDVKTLMQLEGELSKLYNTNLALGKTDEAAATRDEWQKVYDKRIAIQQEGIALKESGIRAELEQKKAAEDAAKAEKDALKEIAQLQRTGLEQYGSERDKMQAKHVRQMDELKEKTKGMDWWKQTDAVNALSAQQAVEMQKIAVEEATKAANDLGPASSGSAGAVRGSTAGISALNRAVSGTRSEQTLAKEAVAVAKQQLAKTTEMARSLSDLLTNALTVNVVEIGG